MSQRITLATERAEVAGNEGHVHHGGLVVTHVGSRPTGAAWISYQDYRLIFRGDAWRVEVDDDLRWASVGQLVIAASDDDTDIPATTGEAPPPLLVRDAIYVIKHDDDADPCQMTMSAACRSV